MRMTGRLRAGTIVLLLLLSIGACGAERTNEDRFGVLSERLGQPLDELTMDTFMRETFTPGMGYGEVHDMLDSIGENQFWKETTFYDGRWMEVVEIRTGTKPLKKENYLNWVFIYDTDANLISVSSRSY